VNFVTCIPGVLCTSKTKVFANLFGTFLLSICLAGCGDRVRLPSAERLAEFENAGPARPVVDVDRLVRAKIGGGPYRVIAGDVLELTMPTILQVVTAEESKASEETTAYVCRVGRKGAITLPVVGEIEAGGKSLAEIESAVIDAYHPDYTVTRPSVFARVLEYETAKVSITGAIQKPGIYSLRSDQMSLVALLMEAEGIIVAEGAGAALIRIIRTPEAAENEERPCQSVPSDAINNASRAEDRNGATVRAAEELPKSDAGKGILLGPRSVSSEQIKVRLTLGQLNSKSTKGVLLVGYDGKVLRVKNVDIRSELHRHTLVRYLGEKDQRFSTLSLEPELVALAQELQTIVSLESYKQLIESLGSQSNTGHQDALKRRDCKPESLVLPVKGLNIPFADVALQDGDTVIVERLELPLVTVVGLVNKPGNFPYPPDTQYNLMQALGFAGGFNQAAGPRYATVYRMKPDRTIVHAIFPLVKGSRMTEALGILIKPGDIVAVEHTPRTRKNVFLDKVFRINFGAYVPLGDLWGGD